MTTVTDLPLRDVEEGMTLATDVNDDNGNLLLAAGTKLSYAALTALARRGVASVPVKQEQEISEEQRMMLRQEIEDRLNAKFRHLQEDPLMNRLKTVLLDHGAGASK